MRTEILEKEDIFPGIDWDKVQVVRLHNSDRVVLTNGKHNGDKFSGTSLTNLIDSNAGEFSDKWIKKLFEPIAKPIEIRFEND